MKRRAAALLAVLMALCLLSACQQEPGNTTQIVNPVSQCTAEDIKALGYGFTLPESAKDAAYSIINLGDSGTIAQVSFVVDGVKYNHRMTAANELTDISGVYLSVEDADAEVEYCPAKVAVDTEGLGKAYWYDVVPGLLYSLSADGTTAEELLTMAEEVFVSAQGDVG